VSFNLRGMIQRTAWECSTSANAADLHNDPSNIARVRVHFSEDSDCLSGQTQGAPEVRLHLIAHLLLRQGFSVAIQAVTCVVAKYVNATEFLEGRSEGGCSSLFRCHIQWQFQDRWRILKVVQGFDLPGSRNKAVALRYNIFADIGADA
jgi:hypothetical protein